MLMAAPTGARKTKADHPALPITIPETVATAAACAAEGADAFHLHVRDAAGLHSIDPGLYAEALAELASAVPDLPIQVTTEAAGVFDVQTQHDTLARLKPTWASICLRDLARDPVLGRRIYAMCADQGTQIQHIVFDAADAQLLADLQSEGTLDETVSVILVLGRYTADMNSDPADLQPLLDALPPIGPWMLCAFGPAEHACLRAAHALGGDLRVGFENSTQQADGTPWPDMPASLTALRASLR